MPHLLTSPYITSITETVLALTLSPLLSPIPVGFPHFCLCFVPGFRPGDCGRGIREPHNPDSRSPSHAIFA